MHTIRSDFYVALLAGDFEQAISIARQQMAERGETAEWLNDLGMAHFMQGQFPDALSHFDRAALKEPAAIEALLNGVVLLCDLGFYSEAESRFQAACAVDAPPQNGPHTLGRSVTHHMSKKHLEMGLVYADLSYWDEAENEFHTALQLEKTPAGHVELARLFLRRHDPGRARAEAECALLLEPHHREATLLLAQALALLERPAQGMALLGDAPGEKMLKQILNLKAGPQGAGH